MTLDHKRYTYVPVCFGPYITRPDCFQSRNTYSIFIRQKNTMSRQKKLTWSQHWYAAGKSTALYSNL